MLPRPRNVILTTATLAICAVISIEGTAQTSNEKAADSVRMKKAGLRKAMAQQQVDGVPLKSGVWETIVRKDKGVVYGPLLETIDPHSVQWTFFPSIFPAERFGRVVPQELLSPDYVSRLSNGSYRVTGSVSTSLGGSVIYEHLITLKGDDYYEHALTVVSHSNTHPVKHFYTGSGHWISPNPLPSQQ